MTLRVGNQEIEARIAEREEARRRYEKAKSQGKRAALVEQHRPNIFTRKFQNFSKCHCDHLEGRDASRGARFGGFLIFAVFGAASARGCPDCARIYAVWVRYQSRI